jgi:hypothetical protein
LASSLILALLFSVLTGTLFINIGESTIPAPSSKHAYVTILSPKNKTCLANPVNLTVAGSSHYWNINLIEYKVDTGSWITLYQNSVYAGWPNNIDRQTSPNLSQGIHTITAKVSAGPYYDMGNVTIAAGIAAPYIAVLSPENRTYSTTEIPLIFETPEMLELSNLQYVLDGNQRVFVSENSSLKGLSEGVHTLIVYGKSLFDTNSGSDTIYFSVDLPFPTTLVIASVITLTVVGVSLLVYFKKRKH